MTSCNRVKETKRQGRIAHHHTDATVPHIVALPGFSFHAAKIRIRRKASRSGYSSDDDDEKEYDNMRGFDPASEDDMDDNGMSRYMENNDEEGWD